MRLSIATSQFAPYIREGITLDTVLKATKNCGFKCVDYEITMDMLGESLDKCACTTHDLLSANGISATQGHAPMFNPLESPSGIDCLDVYTRTLRFCKAANIPQVVIHPGARGGNTREQFFEENVSFYKSLIPAAEKYGVTVLIENIGNYADPYFLWNGADLREMVDRVGHPLFNACWDIGHANHFFAEHTKQYDSIIALGDKLTALHVHDNCGYFDDMRHHHRIDMHSMPYFSAYSSVCFDEVITALKDINYKGTFNFETLFPAPKNVDFIHNGENLTKLRLLPISVWQKFNSALYEMGKYMLEEYGVYEE